MADITQAESTAEGKGGGRKLNLYDLEEERMKLIERLTEVELLIDKARDEEEYYEHNFYL